MKLANFTLLSVFVFLGFGCQSSKTQTVEQATVVEIKLKIGETKELTRAELSESIKEKTIRVYEPHSVGAVDFVGYSLIELLDTQMGKSWKDADGILFTALDGYRSDVSVARILLYKPFLVFSFADKTKSFQIDNRAQNEKDIPLWPFYLVWDNINFKELKRFGAYGWPYQVAKLEPIKYSQYYAKAFPIINPTSNQKKGFEYFKNYCMSCHSVSGEEGGAKGPTLYPNPDVVNKGLKSFRSWVLNPSKIKAGTAMPPLNPQLSNAERKEVSGLIYEYLIALNKKPQ